MRADTLTLTESLPNVRHYANNFRLVVLCACHRETPLGNEESLAMLRRHAYNFGSYTVHVSDPESS